jgi:hypothetical protein
VSRRFLDRLNGRVERNRYVRRLMGPGYWFDVALVAFVVVAGWFVVSFYT